MTPFGETTKTGTPELRVRSGAGRVVLLNGVSSSGKSCIARELLLVLDNPWFHFGVDHVNGLRAKRRTLELGKDELTDVLRRTRLGYHRAVAGMVAAGNDVVMDHVLSEPWRLTDLLTVLDGVPVTFVGVHCDPAELERRERDRADREPGQGLAQLAQVHAHGDYDLEVDTTRTTPAALAARIKALVDHPPHPSAFDRLRTPSTAR
jgi:chloramphenicol 3-O phosphotransferase